MTSNNLKSVRDKVKSIKSLARQQEVPEGSKIESKKRYCRAKEKKEFQDFLQEIVEEEEEEEATSYL